MENPIVFISYSWDDEGHKEWVLNLANQLRRDGVDVILDRYYLRPGRNVPHFVENSLRRSNRVIIVMTPNYKMKAEKRQGGVGQEYSMINNELVRNISQNERIIPLLKSGSVEESVPDFLQQYIYVNFSSNNYDSNYDELLREIYKEPKIKIPELGKKPKFSTKNKRLEETTQLQVENINKSEIDKFKELSKSFSSNSYSKRKDLSANIYELAPSIPLKDILHLTKEKDLDYNIAAAISLKSYIENLAIDIGANPDVRSFVFYGLNHENSLLRYRIIDLISVSESLKQDYEKDIIERAKIEKNKEVRSKINTSFSNVFTNIFPKRPNQKTHIKNKVKDRIAASDLGTALEILKEYLEEINNKNLMNELVLLNAQYSRLMNNKHRNLITLEESDLGHNKIAYSLIYLLDKI